MSRTEGDAMQVITTEQLKKLLDEDHVSVRLLAADGAEIEAGPQFFLRFNADDISKATSAAFIARGFTVTAGERSYKCKDWQSLLRRLRTMGAVTEAGARLTDAGGYQTLSAYEENKAFEALDMRGVVEKYRPIADSFELVGPVPENSGLTQAQADELIAECGKEAEEKTRAYYDALSEEERALLPPFEEVWQTARAEGEAHAKRAANNELNGESPFLCDLVRRGKTRFCEPFRFCWHLYHSASLVCEQASQILSYVGGVDGDDFPNEAKYAPLKPFLLSVTASCSWHCTETDRPHLIYRFRLTDETAAWLLAHEGVYDLTGLDDLAFYRGERILFSSCTHERLRADLSKET